MSLARDGLIPMLTWSRVHEIIENNDLHLLGRSSAQQQVYDDYFDNVISQWVSTRDLILVTKFHFPEGVSTSLPGKKCAIFNDEDLKRPQTLLIKNDFPYHFEPGK